MSDKLEKLKDWGCDVWTAMERMLDDEEFYMECIQAVIDDPGYEKLKQALEMGQAKESFEYAHSLKGIIANTGLTPLYMILINIVEPTRVGNAEGLMPYYDALMKKRDELIEIMNS